MSAGMGDVCVGKGAPQHLGQPPLAFPVPMPSDLPLWQTMPATAQQKGMAYP